MALLPITEHFFPSPDCLAFRQLFECRERQSAKYNFAVLSASSQQRGTSSENQKNGDHPATAKEATSPSNSFDASASNPAPLKPCRLLPPPVMSSTTPVVDPFELRCDGAGFEATAVEVGDNGSSCGPVPCKPYLLNEEHDEALAANGDGNTTILVREGDSWGCCATHQPHGTDACGGYQKCEHLVKYEGVKEINSENYSRFFPDWRHYEMCPEDLEANAALPYRPLTALHSCETDGPGSTNLEQQQPLAAASLADWAEEGAEAQRQDFYYRTPQSLHDFLVLFNNKENGGLVDTNAEMCAIYAEELRWQEARKIVRTYRLQQQQKGAVAAPASQEKLDAAPTNLVSGEPAITEEEATTAMAVPAPRVFLRPGPEVMILRMTSAEEAAAREAHLVAHPPEADQQAPAVTESVHSSESRQPLLPPTFSVHLPALDVNITEHGVVVDPHKRYSFEDEPKYKDGRLHLVEEDGVLYIFAYNPAYFAKQKEHEDGKECPVGDDDKTGEAPGLSAMSRQTSYALASSFGDCTIDASDQKTSCPPHHVHHSTEGSNTAPSTHGHQTESNDEVEAAYDEDNTEDGPAHILQLETEAMFILPICPVRIVGCNAFMESRCRGTPWLRGYEDDPEEDAYVESLCPRPPVMNCASFIDATIGDKILSRAFMLSFQTYRNTCLAAGLPESLTRPLWNFSLLSNIPELQICREMRFRTRAAAAEVERGFQGLRELVQGTEYDLKSYICHPSVFQKLICEARAVFLRARGQEMSDGWGQSDVNEEMVSLLQGIEGIGKFFQPPPPAAAPDERIVLLPEGPLPRRRCRRRPDDDDGEEGHSEELAGSSVGNPVAAAAGTTKADWQALFQKGMLFPRHEVEYGTMTTIRGNRILGRIRKEAQNLFFILVSLATAPVSASQFMKPLDTSTFDYGGTVSMYPIVSPFTHHEQAQVMTPPKNVEQLRKSAHERWQRRGVGRENDSGDSAVRGAEEDADANTGRTSDLSSISPRSSRTDPLLVYVVTEPSPTARGSAKRVHDLQLRGKSPSYRDEHAPAEARDKGDAVPSAPKPPATTHQFMYDAYTFTDGDLVVYDVSEGKWKHLKPYYHQMQYNRGLEKARQNKQNAVASTAARSPVDPSKPGEDWLVEDVDMEDILLCWIKNKLRNAAHNHKNDPGWLRDAKGNIVRERNYYIWGFEHDHQRFYYGLIPKFAREKKKKVSAGPAASPAVDDAGPNNRCSVEHDPTAAIPPTASDSIEDEPSKGNLVTSASASSLTGSKKKASKNKETKSKRVVAAVSGAARGGMSPSKEKERKAKEKEDADEATLPTEQQKLGITEPATSSETAQQPRSVTCDPAFATTDPPAVTVPTHASPVKSAPQGHTQYPIYDANYPSAPSQYAPQVGSHARQHQQHVQGGTPMVPRATSGSPPPKRGGPPPHQQSPPQPQKGSTPNARGCGLPPHQPVRDVYAGSAAVNQYHQQSTHPQRPRTAGPYTHPAPQVNSAHPYHPASQQSYGGRSYSTNAPQNTRPNTSGYYPPTGYTHHASAYGGQPQQQHMHLGGSPPHSVQQQHPAPPMEPPNGGYPAAASSAHLYNSPAAQNAPFPKQMGGGAPPANATAPFIAYSPHQGGHYHDRPPQRGAMPQLQPAHDVHQPHPNPTTPPWGPAPLGVAPSYGRRQPPQQQRAPPSHDGYNVGGVYAPPTPQQQPQGIPSQHFNYGAYYNGNPGVRGASQEAGFYPQMTYPSPNSAPHGPHVGHARQSLSQPPSVASLGAATMGANPSSAAGLPPPSSGHSVPLGDSTSQLSTTINGSGVYPNQPQLHGSIGHRILGNSIQSPPPQRPQPQQPVYTQNHNAYRAQSPMVFTGVATPTANGSVAPVTSSERSSLTHISYTDSGKMILSGPSSPPSGVLAVDTAAVSGHYHQPATKNNASGVRKLPQQPASAEALPGPSDQTPARHQSATSTAATLSVGTRYSWNPYRQQ